MAHKNYKYTRAFNAKEVVEITILAETEEECNLIAEMIVNDYDLKEEKEEYSYEREKLLIIAKKYGLSLDFNETWSRFVHNETILDEETYDYQKFDLEPL